MRAPYFCVRSENKSTPINLEELTSRLRAFIRLRINSGEFTERSLARLFQVSQPHFHNMLKGIRRLNVEISDEIMARFKISILDLIANEELLNYLDESDPEWLTRAAKRKPPTKSTERDNDPRAPWRESGSGS